MAVTTRSQATGDDVDTIPMQKTSPLLWLGLGAGAVLVAGAVIWASSGHGSEAAIPAVKARAAQDPNALTAKEQQEHLKLTQRALERVEAEKKVAPAEEEPGNARPHESGSQETRAKPVAHAARAPAPAAPAKPPKKQLDALDSIGSDITSALE